MIPSWLFVTVLLWNVVGWAWTAGHSHVEVEGCATLLAFVSATVLVAFLGYSLVAPVYLLRLWP